MSAIATRLSTTKEYALLTKPGIIFGNVLTMAAGFALAAKENIPFFLFWKTLLGLSLVIASACVFNNYIDRHLDRKMERTKKRGLVVGTVSEKGALRFATLLGFLGHVFLAIFTNLTTLVAAFLGFLIYLILYSFLKYRSLYATWIGGIAGAMPPIVGYCATGHSFDVAALILFMMIFLWQIPHFFSIALYRFEDYAAANIPVLPLKKGLKKTKEQMLLHIMAFTAVSCLLTVIGRTGYGYLVVVLSFGLGWCWLCFKGFKCKEERLWGRQMFLFSLLTVVALSATMIIF